MASFQGKVDVDLQGTHFGLDFLGNLLLQQEVLGQTRLVGVVLEEAS